MNRVTPSSVPDEPVPINCNTWVGFKSGMKRASQPKDDGMSSLIAKELNQLSIHERSEIYEQLHGVSGDQVDERPEQIRVLTEQLLLEVKRIRDRSAFDKALFLSPLYVCDPNFLAMFLRADNYDLKSAARRLVRHFHHKQDLFGEAKLGRPIYYDDLEDDDKAALRSGRIQMTRNRRDRAGRLIVYSAEGILTYKKPINQVGHRVRENLSTETNETRLTSRLYPKVRAIWYLTMRHLVRDIDTQKLGMVAIRYCVDGKIFDPSDLGYKRAASFLPGALPFKVMAYHFCYNDVMAIPVMSISQMLIGMAWRVRFRAHFGK